MKKYFLKKEGFSLLEIMVAFTILTVAFIAISRSFPYGLAINKTAENLTIASFLAQDKIEELHSLGYDNILLGEVESRHKLSSDQGDYRFFYERDAFASYVDSDLVDSISDSGMKKISVTIYYTNPLSKQTDTYNISTLVSRR